MMTSGLRIELLPQFPLEFAARNTVLRYSHLSSLLSCYLSSPSFCCIHYNLVIYVKENRGGGTSLPHPSLRIPRLAAAFLSLHLVLGSLVKVHLCSQEIPPIPALFSMPHRQGLFTLGYAFSKSSNLAFILCSSLSVALSGCCLLLVL